MKNKTVIKIRSRVNGSVKLEIKSEKEISKVNFAVLKDGDFRLLIESEVNSSAVFTG